MKKIFIGLFALGSFSTFAAESLKEPTMHETSKSIFGKLRDARYATRYLVGQGIDIGAGRDPLGQYHEFFPLMTGCRAWDMPDGDAQYMASVPDAQVDFVVVGLPWWGQGSDRTRLHTSKLQVECVHCKKFSNS